MARPTCSSTGAPTPRIGTQRPRARRTLAWVGIARATRPRSRVAHGARLVALRCRDRRSARAARCSRRRAMSAVARARRCRCVPGVQSAIAGATSEPLALATAHRRPRWRGATGRARRAAAMSLVDSPRAPRELAGSGRCARGRRVAARRDRAPTERRWRSSSARARAVRRVLRVRWLCRATARRDRVPRHATGSPCRRSSGRRSRVARARGRRAALGRGCRRGCAIIDRRAVGATVMPARRAWCSPSACSERRSRRRPSGALASVADGCCRCTRCGPLVVITRITRDGRPVPIAHRGRRRVAVPA